MLRATFLVPYPPGRAPGQRFRFEQWLGLLPEGALASRILPLYSAAAFARLYEPGGTGRKAAQTAAALARRIAQTISARSTDVVFLYREAFPFGPALLEELLARRVPVVYDFDDAIWLRATSAANARVGWLKSPGKVGTIVASATVTTVGNEYLADYARRFSDRVAVVPTTLDIERYAPRPHPPGDRVRVGWSGSPTTSPHLAEIAPALVRMLEELPIELVVLGDPRFRLEGADPARVRVLAWHAETELDDVSAFDIGLMPLPDEEWSRGKCGFKALLYMALGVPAVVSPVGVNTDIVRDGVNGLLAGSSGAWVDAVRRLVEDPALRQRLGAAGRETVVERYSGQRWAPRFLEILEEAAATRP